MRITVPVALNAVADGATFTIATGAITAAGAGALTDVVTPQNVTLYANGGEYTGAASASGGGMAVVFDGGAGNETLPAGDYYIDLELVGGVIDSTGGTPSASRTLVNVGATNSGDVSAAIKANFATLAERIAAIEATLEANNIVVPVA